MNGARNPPQQGVNGQHAALDGRRDGVLRPEMAFLAPPVIARSIQIIATLDLDEGAVKDAFTAFVERHYQTLRAPRRPYEVWPQLGDMLFATG